MISAPNTESLQNSAEQKQIVSKINVQETVLKEQKSSPKKESIINNFMSTVKSLANQKPKHNPLLIDEDIEEQEKMENSLTEDHKVRQEANESIISLPANLKQEALDMMSHEQSKIEEVFEEIKPEITVEITQVTQKGGPLSKYSVYTIKGQDMHGRFQIKRKYSEFQSLRKILTQRWPGSFIPGLKNKIDMKNEQQKQLLVRTILVNFVLGLSYSKHIYYKEEVQLFLRSPDVDICEMFEQMPDLKVSDLISRFEYAFSEQLQQMQGPKITQVILKSHKKLRKIIPKLQQITNKALSLAQSHDSYVKNLLKFGQTMRLYEHFSLAEFTQNSRNMTLLVKDDEKKIDRIKDIGCKNSFYELHTLFEIQLIDAKAFLDTIIAIGLYTLRREELEKQIMQNQAQKKAVDEGSVTIKTMTTRKHKDELSKALEEKLKRLYQEKQDVIKIYQIVEKITATMIIPTFKGIKKNGYFLALRKWIELANKETPELQTIWNFLNIESTETKNTVLNNSYDY